MDAVATNSPSDHVDNVAWLRCLHVRLSSIRQSSGHNSNGSTKNQRLADVPLVKHDGPVYGRYSGFVSSRSHSGVDAPEYPGGVEEALGNTAGVVRGAKAKDVCVGNRPCT